MRVEALVGQGAKVTVVAREKAALAAVEQLGVAVIAADFTAPWETGVKGGLYWMQAALNWRRAPVSWRARRALQGSPLSGGNAGARRRPPVR